MAKDYPPDPPLEDMPAEFDFSNAVRGLHYRPLGDEITVRIEHADGTVEVRRQRLQPRIDAAVCSPAAVSGVLHDEIYYIYNPENDAILVRLMSSLSDALVAVEDEQGFQVLLTEEGRQPVGIIVRDFTQRFDLPDVDLAANRDVLERGIERLSDRLPWAA